MPVFQCMRFLILSQMDLTLQTSNLAGYQLVYAKNLVAQPLRFQFQPPMHTDITLPFRQTAWHARQRLVVSLPGLGLVEPPRKYRERAARQFASASHSLLSFSRTRNWLVDLLVQLVAIIFFP